MLHRFDGLVCRQDRVCEKRVVNERRLVAVTPRPGEPGKKYAFFTLVIIVIFSIWAYDEKRNLRLLLIL
jgi:hypothetical protein